MDYMRNRSFDRTTRACRAFAPELLLGIEPHDQLVPRSAERF